MTIRTTHKHSSLTRAIIDNFDNLTLRVGHSFSDEKVLILVGADRPHFTDGSSETARSFASVGSYLGIGPASVDYKTLEHSVYHPHQDRVVLAYVGTSESPDAALKDYARDMGLDVDSMVAGNASLTLAQVIMLCYLDFGESL